MFHPSIYRSSAISPFSPDQSKLKKYALEIAKSASAEEAQLRVAKAMRKLDENPQVELEDLLNTRNQYSSKPFGGQFVAITQLPDSQNDANRKPSWRRERKGISMQWLVVLKGWVASCQKRKERGRRESAQRLQ
jgi:hypothetical protein